MKTKITVDEIEKLSFGASGRLAHLQWLANNGNTAAANALINTLVKAIHQLYVDAPKQRKIFSKIARPNNIWPGFITVEKDWKTRNEAIIKLLQLGEDARFNYKGKGWSRANPENNAAWILVGALCRQQQFKLMTLEELAQRPKTKMLPAKLPPFNQQTLPEWCKAGLAIFENQFGKDFENHPLFAEKYAWSKTRQAQADGSGLAFKVWQRNEIKDKVRQAFKTIVRKDRPPLL
jgi:hypothetical protein